MNFIERIFSGEAEAIADLIIILGAIVAFGSIARSRMRWKKKIEEESKS